MSLKLEKSREKKGRRKNGKKDKVGGAGRGCGGAVCAPGLRRAPGRAAVGGCGRAPRPCGQLLSPALWAAAGARPAPDGRAAPRHRPAGVAARPAAVHSPLDAQRIARLVHALPEKQRAALHAPAGARRHRLRGCGAGGLAEARLALPLESGAGPGAAGVPRCGLGVAGRRGQRRAQRHDGPLRSGALYRGLCAAAPAPGGGRAVLLPRPAQPAGRRGAWPAPRSPCATSRTSRCAPP